MPVKFDPKEMMGDEKGVYLKLTNGNKISIESEFKVYDLDDGAYFLFFSPSESPMSLEQELKEALRRVAKSDKYVIANITSDGRNEHFTVFIRKGDEPIIIDPNDKVVSLSKSGRLLLSWKV